MIERAPTCSAGPEASPLPASARAAEAESAALLALRAKRRQTRRLAIGLCFLAPHLIGFLVFTLGPVLASIALSLTRWDLLTAPEFVGFDNYAKLLGFARFDGHWQPRDPNFWKYLWNTIYMMGVIPISMAGSLVLALALNRKIFGRVLLRTLFFLPSMCMPVAVYLLWRWIFNSDAGLLNWVLGSIGVAGPDWLLSPRWAKPALMMATFWASVGGANMILFLAGLQNIPSELYEAATIDGAGPIQRFRHITWPLLTPTTFFILITSLIGGFQGGFEAAYMMTNGGPAGSTTTLMFYIYSNAFEWLKMGYAATIAWILFILVFCVTLIQWKVGGRHVHYY